VSARAFTGKFAWTSCEIQFLTFARFYVRVLDWSMMTRVKCLALRTFFSFSHAFYATGWYYQITRYFWTHHWRRDDTTNVSEKVNNFQRGDKKNCLSKNHSHVAYRDLSRSQKRVMESSILNHLAHFDFSYGNKGGKVWKSGKIWFFDKNKYRSRNYAKAFYLGRSTSLVAIRERARKSLQFR